MSPTGGFFGDQVIDSTTRSGVAARVIPDGKMRANNETELSHPPTDLTTVLFLMFSNIRLVCSSVTILTSCLRNTDSNICFGIGLRTIGYGGEYDQPEEASFPSYCKRSRSSAGDG